MFPVKFTPIPVPRIWGGHQLKSMFHTQLSEPIGEYWVLSAYPTRQSVVAEGPLAGQSLNDLVRVYPEDFLGESPQPRFPLLIKYLEADQNLSVQVHPNDVYAQTYESDFGKTEAWYILSAQGERRICLGHDFNSRADFESAIATGEIKSHLQYREITAGEMVYIPAGTVHALLAGTSVIEIQQTSDLTYRIYDWDRVSNGGEKRALHIKEAAEVINFPTEETKKNENKIGVIEEPKKIVSPYFIIEEIVLETDFPNGQSRILTFHLGRERSPDMIICVKGNVQIRVDNEKSPDFSLHLSPGEVGLIPATVHSYEMIWHKECILLRVHY
ncbi:type I phosphomannose isomerase catalytic subunit [Sulfoacidibacillus thermotolerans]|uniref:Phosphomannose isomerase type I catalytic domain-containing protein n=1 Tax=Sulfoacidibacillus thermotolerans TaxID=1765684 RepID=A0A2U3D6Y2_SULT2|nr:type I phosphomannose isomerase catalytic subunit [Sulfoacidibacillus thermotolerans]PWI57037.1 hypothetical protein BM613_10775 [Sulfoacidibacillus thermotolerans]